MNPLKLKHIGLAVSLVFSAGAMAQAMSKADAKVQMKTKAANAAASDKAGPPRTVQRGKRHPMTMTDFKRKGSLVATLVEVGSLGHAWSGGVGGPPFSDVRRPDASRMVWAFAARQFRG